MAPHTNFPTVPDNFDDLERIANKIADISLSSDATTQIEVAVRDLVPQSLHEFFHFCITNAYHPIDVDSAVIRMRKSRKTLSNWLAAAKLPPPARIIGWMRVLVAARMLEDTTRSTEKVARELNFMSGTALRNMLRRYLKCGPEQVRQHGGFDRALRMFVSEIQTRKKRVAKAGKIGKYRSARTAAARRALVSATRSPQRSG